LNPGLTIKLADLRKKDENGDPYGTTFCFEGGVSDFVKFLNQSKKPLHDDVLYIRTEKENVQIEVALQYQSDYIRDGVLYSYVNNIKTHEGGTHETGFKSALTKTIVGYITSNGLVKGEEQPIGDDTRVGLTAIVSVKVVEPQFEGQTKGKLGNSFVRPIVESTVSEAMTLYLEQNPETAKAIAAKVIDSFDERMAAKRAREESRNKKENQNSSSTLPEKLADCNRKTAFEDCELFLVEGDSAGGTAKNGRNSTFQAILPLRGKVLNSEKATITRLRDNREIRDIYTAIGTDIDDEFDYEKLRYGKVVIMTDADVDGSHICVLLLTFFFRYMRDLVEKGHIYLANPPLFKLAKGKRNEYAYSEAERDAKMKEMGGKIEIQRYKGLGEMNKTQIWETTMDPEERTLYRVTIEDAAQAEIVFTELMGDEPEPRKEFLQKNSHQAMIDA
jgi:DNA gyrase subunit B